MSDTKLVFIPSMSLNYEDNVLDSVGIGGELYRRETPLRAENAVLKAENARLRELARVLWHRTENENKAQCEGCYEEYGECPIERRMRELGLEGRR